MSLLRDQGGQRGQCQRRVAEGAFENAAATPVKRSLGRDEGDLQAAGQAFAKVSQAYPSHAKVPDSLFKLADVERRLGNNDKARGILQQVIAQYPGSSAAQLAQRDLQRL